MPSPKHADSPKQMFTNPLDDDDRSPMQRKPSSTGRGGAKPKREIKRATADQMREITERGKMAPEQLVDLFGKDSQPVVSKARGQMLIATFNHLFDHLRDKKDDTADTYGLWLVDHSSSEEEDAIDLTGVEGITHYDKRMRHVEAKNWKKAMEAVDVQRMPVDELQELLAERGLSKFGDKKVLANRLEKALDKEAAKMRDPMRMVKYFISHDVQLNLQTMISKMNKDKHGTLQRRLADAKTSIENLSKLHDVIDEQRDIIQEDERLLAEAYARIAELERTPNKIHVIPVFGETSVGEEFEIAHDGLPCPTHTMTTATSRLPQRQNATDPWRQWRLEDVAVAKADKKSCHVVILDTSGRNWTESFKKVKSKDGRQICVHQTGWHLINVTTTSHFGGVAIVDILHSNQLLGRDSYRGMGRIVADLVIVCDPPTTAQCGDYKHQLMGFAASGVPCIPSVDAILLGSRPPAAYSAMLGLRNKRGMPGFPLLDLVFVASQAPQPIAPKLPAVVTLGTTEHGRAGAPVKFVATTPSEFASAKAVAAVTADYYTIEPALPDVNVELLIQSIGNDLRVFKRTASARTTPREWADWAHTKCEAVKPVDSRYKKWAEAASTLWGGLVMFALEAIETRSGNAFITCLHIFSLPLGANQEDTMAVVAKFVGKMDLNATTKIVAKQEMQAFATIAKNA